MRSRVLAKRGLPAAAALGSGASQMSLSVAVLCAAAAPPLLGWLRLKGLRRECTGDEVASRAFGGGPSQSGYGCWHST